MGGVLPAPIRPREPGLTDPDRMVAFPMFPGFMPLAPILRGPMKPAPPFGPLMEELPMAGLVPMFPPDILLGLVVPIIWADATAGSANARVKARHIAILLFLDMLVLSRLFIEERANTPPLPTPQGNRVELPGPRQSTIGNRS